MIKNFFKLFRELVNDDEIESLEILSKFLKSHDLHTRVQYLRYLLIEHENGVLEALHEVTVVVIAALTYLNGAEQLRKLRKQEEIRKVSYLTSRTSQTPVFHVIGPEL